MRRDIQPERVVKVKGITGTARVVEVDEESRIAYLIFDGGRQHLNGWFPFARLEPIKNDETYDPHAMCPHSEYLNEFCRECIREWQDQEKDRGTS